MQSAGMLQQKALQQFGIEPIHIVDQLVKAVLMTPKPETQGQIAERGMLVDQQDASVRCLCTRLIAK